MRTLVLIFALLQLGGCAIIQSTGLSEQKPEVTKSMLVKEFDAIPSPASGKQLSVAVYSFGDKTGQRRPQANVASLSTAVTQGAETFLIQALQNVGRGQWFEVVERVGIDNLTKERLIIRQMREAYLSAKAVGPQVAAPNTPQIGFIWKDLKSSDPLALGKAAGGSYQITQSLPFPGGDMLKRDSDNDCLYISRGTILKVSANLEFNILQRTSFLMLEFVPTLKDENSIFVLRSSFGFRILRS
jgi:hypothetical protein